jgi:hypothetical protein
MNSRRDYFIGIAPEMDCVYWLRTKAALFPV